MAVLPVFAEDLWGTVSDVMGVYMSGYSQPCFDKKWVGVCACGCVCVLNATQHKYLSCFKCSLEQSWGCAGVGAHDLCSGVSEHIIGRDASFCVGNPRFVSICVSLGL